MTMDTPTRQQLIASTIERNNDQAALTCCIFCEHAREHAAHRLSVVGCAAIANGSIKPESVSGGDVYEGWFYGGRRPGDTDESDRSIGRGAITRHCLTDWHAECPGFTPVRLSLAREPVQVLHALLQGKQDKESSSDSEKAQKRSDEATPQEQPRNGMADMLIL